MFRDNWGVENPFGPAAQLGVDIGINERWFVNLSARYIDIDDDARGGPAAPDGCRDTPDASGEGPMEQEQQQDFVAECPEERWHALEQLEDWMETPISREPPNCARCASRCRAFETISRGAPRAEARPRECPQTGGDLTLRRRADHPPRIVTPSASGPAHTSRNWRRSAPSTSREP